MNNLKNGTHILSIIAHIFLFWWYPKRSDEKLENDEQMINGNDLRMINKKG